MKVFIADESISFRSVLANSLKDLTGAEIVGMTGDCHEAIQGISDYQPDVIILNINMERGTGVDVLRGIRKHRNSSPVAIMVANYPYNQTQQSQLGLGAEYFLHKFTQFGDIISVVKNLMATQKAERVEWIGDDDALCYN